MKELKFRFWDKEMEVMLCPPNHHLSLSITGDPCNYQTGQGGNDYIVMQFTGLRDKAGKEIYEGDIVKHEYEDDLNVIKFGTGYQGKPADGMYLYWGWCACGWGERGAFMGYDVEIIGNKYENPKLMEVET